MSHFPKSLAINPELTYHGTEKYVDSTEQLVTEIVVRDIQRSTKFYRELGF